MATYGCDACGVAVNASCAKCDSLLVVDSLTLDDGTVVQISKCSECEGKIKSPQCCGTDYRNPSILLGSSLFCLTSRPGQPSMRQIELLVVYPSQCCTLYAIGKGYHPGLNDE